MGFGEVMGVRLVMIVGHTTNECATTGFFEVMTNISQWISVQADHIRIVDGQVVGSRHDLYGAVVQIAGFPLASRFLW